MVGTDMPKVYVQQVKQKGVLNYLFFSPLK